MVLQTEDLQRGPWPGEPPAGIQEVGLLAAHDGEQPLGLSQHERGRDGWMHRPPLLEQVRQCPVPAEHPVRGVRQGLLGGVDHGLT